MDFVLFDPVVEKVAQLLGRVDLWGDGDLELLGALGVLLIIVAVLHDVDQTQHVLHSGTNLRPNTSCTLAQRYKPQTQHVLHTVHNNGTNRRPNPSCTVVQSLDPTRPAQWYQPQTQHFLHSGTNLRPNTSCTVAQPQNPFSFCTCLQYFTVTLLVLQCGLWRDKNLVPPCHKSGALPFTNEPPLLQIYHIHGLYSILILSCIKLNIN